MNKIVILEYKVSSGDTRQGYFIKVLKKYYPIILCEGFLDESQKVINEQEVNLNIFGEFENA